MTTTSGATPTPAGPEPSPLVMQLRAVKAALVPAMKLFGVAGVIGSLVLLFMVYRDTTPEGQANIAEREKTQRIMIQSLTEQDKTKLARDQLEFERAKWEADQKQKGN